MDQQIQQAVEIALSATADPILKNQAYEFVSQIKSTEEGYKSCLDILLNAANSNENLNQEFTFFLYQVIDEYIRKLNDEQLFDLNCKLFQVLRNMIQFNKNEPVYLRSKFAGVMANLFVHTYLNINQNFLKDLLASITEYNLVAIDLYSRILIAIHSEIGDKFISHSKDSQDRINLLKDKIRSDDMVLLVENWKSVLKNPETVNNDPNILNNFLKIYGYYISWMEITLFLSEDFVHVLLNYLKKPQQQNETCMTLIEIISKKMKADNKLELISVLNLTSAINSIGEQNDDVEFIENMAKLSNQVGIELLIALESASATLYESVQQQLMLLWPSILRFLLHEYDDVSQQVFPFIQLYLLLCKKMNQLVSVDLLSSLLDKLIFKMKFDEEDDGLDDDSTEQFEEIRSKLKIFQDTIAVLKPELYLEALPIVINESIFSCEGSLDKADWRNIELGLFEIQSFADSLRNNIINLPKQHIHSSEPFVLLQNFFVKLINSEIILKLNHPKIQLAFFEFVVRHYQFLTQGSPITHDLILRILDIFASPLGLFNEIEKVRFRARYLFYKFVRLTKPALSDPSYIESLFLKIQPSLLIKPQLPTKDKDGDIVDNSDFNNQLNLFESIGLLISQFSVSLIVKLEMIDSVFQPLFLNLEKCIANRESNVEIIVLEAYESLMAIGSFARGYDSEPNSKYPQEIISKFENVSQVVLITLENFSKFEMIREASRFCFARLIPILKDESSAHLSKLFSIIMTSDSLKISEFSDFLNFLGQIVHTFKTNDNIYQLFNSIFTPLMDKIFVLLKYNGENDEYSSMPDIARDKEDLKKAYMNFISSVITNHLSSLMITETNKQKFPVLLESFFEHAYNLSEASVSKLAITQLNNVVNVMGANGGKVDDPEDKYGASLPPIEGVDQYLMKNVIQLCFELPFQKQEFDLQVPEYRQIAQELSSLLKTYEEKKGDEYLNYLSNYLTTMGLSNNLMNDFGNNLIKLDRKGFRKYFISFVTELKRA